MPGIVPFIPLISAAVLGGVGAVDANVQNKAAIKNRDNATATAQAQVGQNQQNALNQIGQLAGSPAGSAQKIGAVPNQPVYNSVGSVGQNGMPPGTVAPPSPNAASGAPTPQAQAAMKQIIAQYLGGGASPA